MSNTKPKPVYGVREVAADSYAITRNDVEMLTPAGNLLAVPTRPLADMIEAEWQAQGNKIQPSTMPLTQLAATTIDITSQNRPKVVGEILAYVDSELLCHRVDQPEALATRQAAIWQPVLDWCHRHYGAALKIGIGIMPIMQKAEAKLAFEQAISAYDDWKLTGLRQAVDCSGSLVLGLALMERHLTLEQVVAASMLDTLFQMEKWGEDPAIVQHNKQMTRDLHDVMCWRGLI